MTVELNGCTELAALFSSLLSDIKNGTSLWEDAIIKGSKLSNVLRATVYASNAFLDSIQRLADLASKTNGGSKEIGASLTRLCMRQKRLGTKVKSISNQLITCLANPLSSKLDEWKRIISHIEKQHSRDAKRTRSELKRAVSDANRLRRKLAKHENSAKGNRLSIASGGVGIGVGLGQPPTAQSSLSSLSSSGRPLSTLRSVNNSGGTSSLAVQAEAALRTIEEKARMVEDVERDSLKRLMLEERERFCFFVNCMKPSLESETSMLCEISTLNDLLIALTMDTQDSSQLMPDAEGILARAGANARCGQQRGRGAHRGPCGAPILNEETSIEEAFAVAAVAAIEEHQRKASRTRSELLSDGQSNASSLFGQPSYLQSVEQNSLSAYSGIASASSASTSQPLTGGGDLISLESSVSSSSDIVTRPLQSVMASAAHQMAAILRQSRGHQELNPRSASVGRVNTHQHLLNVDGRCSGDIGGASVVLRRPTTAAFSGRSAAPTTIGPKTLVASSATAAVGGGSLTVNACTSQISPASNSSSEVVSMYSEIAMGDRHSDSFANTSLQRQSTTTLQMSTNLARTENEEENDDDEEDDEEVTDGSIMVDSENDLIAEDLDVPRPPMRERNLSSRSSLKSGRHTISSTYDRVLTGSKRATLTSLTYEQISSAKNGDLSGAILYPDQILPPPVYTNLNQLTNAAQRKFSMVPQAVGAVSDSGSRRGGPAIQQHSSAGGSDSGRGADDNVSVASAPIRHPSSTNSSSIYGSVIVNSGGSGNAPKCISTLLCSAPGSPQCQSACLGTPEDVDSIVNGDSGLTAKNSSNSHQIQPIVAGFAPFAQKSQMPRASLRTSIVSSTGAEDPFSLEMEELDRMAAAGSSGASSTNALSNGGNQSGEVIGLQKLPHVESLPGVSGRPLSQHSTGCGVLGGLPQHYHQVHNTGVPVGLQALPSGRLAGGAAEIGRSGSNQHTRFRSSSRERQSIEALQTMSLSSTTRASNISPTSPQTKEAAIRDSCPVDCGPPTVCAGPLFLVGVNADSIGSALAHSSASQTNGPNNKPVNETLPLVSKSESKLSPTAPRGTEEDIDAQASSVASTAASLLSQLSGQLQQLTATSAGHTVALPINNQFTAARIPSHQQVIAMDGEFDLPTPPSPDLLDSRENNDLNHHYQQQRVHPHKL